jgi:hypothetical protein
MQASRVSHLRPCENCGDMLSEQRLGVLFETAASTNKNGEPASQMELLGRRSHLPDRRRFSFGLDRGVNVAEVIHVGLLSHDSVLHQGRRA